MRHLCMITAVSTRTIACHYPHVTPISSRASSHQLARCRSSKRSFIWVYAHEASFERMSSHWINGQRPLKLLSGTPSITISVRHIDGTSRLEYRYQRRLCTCVPPSGTTLQAPVGWRVLKRSTADDPRSTDEHMLHSPDLAHSLQLFKHCQCLSSTHALRPSQHEAKKALTLILSACMGMHRTPAPVVSA